jgi:cysteinyl-tRNA synthetase
MSLRLFNTLTRQKDLFEPVRPGKVGMYLCGMTVDEPPHIGHMVGPVVLDTLKRYLRYKGFEVTYVVGINDVDGVDPGDAERHAASSASALAAMGVDTVTEFPRASQHVADIISATQALVEKGDAYPAGGSVWFDVTRDADYGKLSSRHPSSAQVAAHAPSEGRRHPADFPLWQAVNPGEQAWESPWGAGRPCWHAECSTMSRKILGNSFDIHGGGVDLLFPHHENERAQSESITGKPFARFWLHNGLARVSTKQVGGNTESPTTQRAANVAALEVARLVEQHGGDVLRYLLLSTHYRSPIDVSDDAIASAGNRVAAFSRLFDRIEQLTGKPAAEKQPDLEGQSGTLLEVPLLSGFVKSMLVLKSRFLEVLDDDFNTAGAISVLHEITDEINELLEQNQAESAKPSDVIGAAGAAVQTLRAVGAVLGLFIKKAEAT